jgi:hypothetical protein
MDLTRVTARTIVMAAAALSAALIASIPGDAAPMKFGQRPSDCKSWDCQGGIICSCCFSNGCWICDRTWSPHTNDYVADFSSCHWDDARTITPQLQLPNLTPTPTLQPSR